jgi:hypothetical protein
MTKLPNLPPRPGRGASDEFVHPEPEAPHPVVAALHRRYAR